MSADLGRNLLLTLAPAALGLALGSGLVLRARAGLTIPQEAAGRMLLVLAVPASSLPLALVGAVIAADSGWDLDGPLAWLGAAAFAQCLLQGWLGAQRLRAIVEKPESLARALLLLALPEVLTVAALAWLFTQASIQT